MSSSSAAGPPHQATSVPASAVFLSLLCSVSWRAVASPPLPPLCSNWDALGWFEGQVVQVDLGCDLEPGEDNPNEDIEPGAIYLNIQ